MLQLHSDVHANKLAHTDAHQVDAQPSQLADDSSSDEPSRSARLACVAQIPLVSLEQNQLGIDRHKSGLTYATYLSYHCESDIENPSRR